MESTLNLGALSIKTEDGAGDTDRVEVENNSELLNRSAREGTSAMSGLSKISMDEIFVLFDAADQMITECSKYLKETLKSDNAVKIWDFAKRHKERHDSCRQLEVAVLKFILGDFEEFMKTEAFLKLDESDLKAILMNNKLQVRSIVNNDWYYTQVSEEETVWDALMKWIYYEKVERKKHFGTLVEAVRFGLVTKTWLRSVALKNEFVAENPAVKKIISSILASPRIHHPTCSKRIKEKPKEVANSHYACRFAQELLLLVGYDDEGEKNAVKIDFHLFDTNIHDWHQVDEKSIMPLKEFNTLSGFARMENSVYLFGAKISKQKKQKTVVKRVLKYDIPSFKWKEVAAMNVLRVGGTFVTLNGCIYFIGGTDPSDDQNREKFKTVEKYDPIADKWTLCAPMLEYRSSGPNSIAFENQIYVFGGKGVDNKELKSVERYDPELDQWFRVKPMLYAVERAISVQYQGYLWVIAGRRNEWTEVECQKYNHKTNTWSKMPSLAEETIIAKAAVVFEDSIYVMGKHNPHRVQVFDGKSKKWGPGPSSGSMCEYGLVWVFETSPELEDIMKRGRNKRDFCLCDAEFNTTLGDPNFSYD